MLEAAVPRLARRGSVRAVGAREPAPHEVKATGLLELEGGDSRVPHDEHDEHHRERKEGETELGRATHETDEPDPGQGEEREAARPADRGVAACKLGELTLDLHEPRRVALTHLVHPGPLFTHDAGSLPRTSGRDYNAAVSKEFEPLPPIAVPTGHPPGRGIYCNRTLNLRSIKVIGYDMDYTLVHYRVREWERRAYEYLRDGLAVRGFPVNALEFDHDLVVRGLVVDVQRGNLLKVNRFGFVKQGLHGTTPIEHELLRRTYLRTIIDLSDPRYVFLNTLFSLSEGCMYAQLVDKIDAGEIPSLGRPEAPGEAHAGYRALYDAVRSSIDAAHTEGQLKAEVVADPERYVDLDEGTVLALLDQFHSGKRLLLITNSEIDYTAAMMGYAFDRFLPGNMTWRELFELSVCGARKPGFFESRAPLLEVVDLERGLLKPQLGPLRAHGVYFGGNASAVEQHLGVAGDEILYLGDHMFGDVHVSKQVLRWRTGLILRELEDEIAAVEGMNETHRALGEMMREKERLEDRFSQMRLDLQRQRAGYAARNLDSPERLTVRMARLRSELVALDERIAPLAVASSRALNDRWGLLMRAGNDKSQLARQIERYADIYTSRVSNFVYATPFAYLRSPRGSLPHDALTPGE
ncbi:MAG: HAD-IG family 5'-nucleotidase [Deltaproteobacteria bacterium]|nr:HAD-IG family 5'-nucleotidase [Deltaproteobacteria bacterium]